MGIPGYDPRIDLDPFLEEASRKHGVPRNLIEAMIQTESNWNPNAVSKRGAQGLLQLMPGTQREMGLTEPFNPAKNLDAGVGYFAKKLKEAGGDQNLALMYYNAGKGNIQKGIVPRETTDYVNKIKGLISNVGYPSDAGAAPKRSIDEIMAQAALPSMPQRKRSIDELMGSGLIQPPQRKRSIDEIIGGAAPAGMAPAPRGIPTPGEEPGFWSEAGKGLISGSLGLGESLGSTMQWAGVRTGIDALKTAGKSIEETFAGAAKPYEAHPSLQGAIVENPELMGKAAWWAYNVSNVLPSLAATIIPGMGGAKVVNILGKTYKWSEPLIKKLATLGSGIAGGAVGGVLEGSSTFKEVLAKGGTEQEAAKAGELMALAAGALNAISVGKALSPGVSGKLMHILKSAGVESITEYLEEPAEVGIKYGMGFATPKEAWQQLKEGINVIPPTFVTGGLGGAAGVLRRPTGQPTGEGRGIVPPEGVVPPEGPPGAFPGTPAPGMVRFYHGGIPGEGQRDLTPDLEYAKGYAEKTPGAVVQYVDIPEDSPLLSKVFDDTGTTPKAPYAPFTAPEDIMKGAKVLGGTEGKVISTPPVPIQGDLKDTVEENWRTGKERPWDPDAEEGSMGFADPDSRGNFMFHRTGDSTTTTKYGKWNYENMHPGRVNDEGKPIEVKLPMVQTTKGMAVREPWKTLQEIIPKGINVTVGKNKVTGKDEIIGINFRNKDEKTGAGFTELEAGRWFDANKPILSKWFQGPAAAVTPTPSKTKTETLPVTEGLAPEYFLPKAEGATAFDRLPQAAQDMVTRIETGSKGTKDKFRAMGDGFSMSDMMKWGFTEKEFFDLKKNQIIEQTERGIFGPTRTMFKEAREEFGKAPVGGIPVPEKQGEIGFGKKVEATEEDLGIPPEPEEGFGEQSREFGMTPEEDLLEGIPEVKKGEEAFHNVFIGMGKKTSVTYGELESYDAAKKYGADKLSEYLNSKGIKTTGKPTTDAQKWEKAVELGWNEEALAEHTPENLNRIVTEGITPDKESLLTSPPQGPEKGVIPSPESPIVEPGKVGEAPVATPLPRPVLAGEGTAVEILGKKGPEIGELPLQPGGKIEPKLRLAPSEQYAPVFYSQMEKKLADPKGLPGTAHPEQIRSLVNTWASKGEIKAEELKWSGLDDWLRSMKGLDVKITKVDQVGRAKSGFPPGPVTDILIGDKWYTFSDGVKIEANNEKQAWEEYAYEKGITLPPNPSGKVTKEEVIDFLRENQVEVKEVTKGFPNTFGPEDETVYTTPKFYNWQLPGGENYRELLFTLPEKKRELLHFNRAADAEKYAKENNLQSSDYTLEFPGPGEGVNIVPTGQERRNYTSGHWSEPNVIAHARFNDRTDAQGNKVLFLEEVQADRDVDIRRVKAEVKKLEPAGKDASSQKAEIERLKNLMPFSGKEYELVMKRMIRWAAENGYDWIAWTTGEQQADRYNLSKHIDALVYVFDKASGQYQITPMKDGHDVFTKYVSPKELPDLVGKEIAQKIEAGKGQQLLTEHERSGMLNDLDLNIGGEGKRELYDKIIPDYLNKYAKKWGAKVEETNLDISAGKSLTGREPGFAPDGVATVHSLPITDSMKMDVLHTGQPRFALAPILQGNSDHKLAKGITDDQAAELINLIYSKAPRYTVGQAARNIMVNPEVAKKSIQDWRLGNLKTPVSPLIEAAGMTEFDILNGEKARAIITFSLSNNGQPLNYEEIEDTTWHEIAHAIKPVLETGQNRILDEAFANEELMAEGLKDYARKKKTPPGPVKRVFDAILDFISKIQNWMQANGFQSVDSIFEKMYQGEFAEKEISPSVFKIGEMPMPEGVMSAAQEANGMPHYANPEAFRQLRLMSDKEIENPLLHPILAGKTAFNKKFLMGIENKDMRKFVRTIGNPFFWSLKHKNFAPVLDAQLKGMENNEKLFQEFLRDPNLKAEDPHEDHPFFLLNKEDAQKVGNAAIYSTAKNVILDDDTLKSKYGFDDNLIKVYHDTQKSTDKIWKSAIDVFEFATYRPYMKNWWFKDFYSVMHGNAKLNPDGSFALDADGQKIIVKKDAKEVLAYMNRVDQVAFQRAMESINPDEKKIADLRREFRKLKFYFPLSHGEGEYVARVWKTNKQGKEEFLGAWFRENEFALRRVYDKEIKKYEDKEGYRVEYGIERKLTESFFQQISDIHTQKFVENAVERLKSRQKITADQASDMKNAIFDVLVQDLKARGFGRHMIGRIKGPEGRAIEGYRTENPQELLYNYMKGAAGYLSKIPKAWDFYEAISDNINPDPKKGQPILFAATTQYTKDMLRNDEQVDRWFGKARGVAFFMYLAWSLKAGGVNFSQNFVSGIPWTARMMKDLKVEGLAEKVYLTAMKDVMLGKLSEGERAGLKDAVEKGETMDQWIREISGRVKDKYGAKFDEAVRLGAWVFSKMEIYNRKSAFIAGYRTAIEAGLSPEEASKKGIELIHLSHYLMGKSNNPQAMRREGGGGAFLRTAYTFKSYMHNYFLTMYHSMAKDEEGKRHFDVIGRSMAYMVVLGGVLAIPWLDDILDDVERIAATPYRAQMRRFFRKHGGEALERFAMGGLPALIFGVDISGSIKIGSPHKLISGPLYGKPLQGVEESVFGVYGGLGQKLLKATDNFWNKEYLRALESASPAGIEAMLKTYRNWNDPVTNARGATVFDEKGQPVRLTGTELVGQAAGFRPSRLAELSREKRTFRNIEAAFADKKQNLADRMRMSKTPEDQQKIMVDIQAYNMEAMKYQGSVPMITPDSLRKTMTQKPETRWMRYERMMND